MWDRVLLKYKARKSLNGTYVNGLIVSFIMLLASGDWLSKKNSGNLRISNTFNGELDYHNMMEIPKRVIENIGISTFIGAVIAFFSFLTVIVFIKIIIGYIIEVGGSKYFLKASQGESTINHLAFGFKSGMWLNIVRTMFFRSVFTFLWGLLLIIPGIIKSYSYRMVPYILTENPDMDSFEAIALSQAMTSGSKMKMFLMDLSFIGWFILGLCFFGIGIVFVMPYYNGTYAELYGVLKYGTAE